MTRCQHEISVPKCTKHQNPCYLHLPPIFHRLTTAHSWSVGNDLEESRVNESHSLHEIWWKWRECTSKSYFAQLNGLSHWLWSPACAKSSAIVVVPYLFTIGVQFSRSYYFLIVFFGCVILLFWHFNCSEVPDKHIYWQMPCIGM